jgi:hypothetical protein
MRIGRFKIGKVYPEGGKVQWAVLGKNDKKLWVLCFDETRRPKELLFDLQFDACAYLEGFVEWQTGELLQHRIAQGAVKRADVPKMSYSVAAAKRNKNRAKNKAAKRSRKRNR